MPKLKLSVWAVSFVLVLFMAYPICFAFNNTSSDLQPTGNGTLLTPSTQNLDVDLSTGAMTTSVPVQVPEGRAVIVPKVDIQYNSFNKEGSAGLGWNVSLGSIERSANKGVPNYDNNTDQFFLNQSGPRTELVRINGGSEYKARIEGSFLKIEFIDSTYWVVTDREGTKSRYGYASASRVQDPADSSKVYKYLLDRVEDIYGNYMTISYTDNSADPTEDRYLFEINYTGYICNSQVSNCTGVPSIAPYAKVKFNYTDNRPDSRFSNMSGFTIKHSKRLSSVEVFALNDQLQRRYELTYTVDPQTNVSLLTKVRLFGSDGTTALPDTNYEYSTFTTADLGFEPAIVLAPGRFPPEAFESGKIRLMDMNGDGRSDMVYSPAEGQAWQIYFSDETGNFGTAQSALNSPSHLLRVFTHVQPSVVFGDFNGDALIDVTYFSASGQQIWLNNGQNGYNFPVQNSIVQVLNGRDHVFFDINDDGYADLIKGSMGINPVPWSIQLNDGNAQFASPYLIPVSGNPPNTNGNNPLYLKLFDFNGDGRIDIWNGLQIHINNGNMGFNASFSTPDFIGRSLYSNYFADINSDGLIDWVDLVIPWEAHYNLGNIQFSEAQEMSSYPLWNGAIFMDMNGDDLPDAVYSAPQNLICGQPAVWSVSANDNGKAFKPPVTIGNHHPTETFFWDCGNTDEVNLAFADINGDGRVDMVYGGPDGYQVYLAKRPAKASRNGLLIKVDDSMGTQTEITYGASPIKGLLGPQYANAFQSILFNTVSTKKVTTVNGVYETNYTYEGGLWNAKEREFRGFAKVTQEDPDGNITEMKFHQDDLRKGRMYEQTTSNSAGQPFTKTVNTWTSQNINPGVDFVLQSQTDHYTYDGTSSARRTQKKFIYGESPQYGNLTQHIELGEVNALTGADTGSDKRSTETTYGNNTANGKYLLGFPQHIVKKDNTDVIARQTWFYYDKADDNLTNPVKGLLTKVKEWGGWSGQDVTTQMNYDVYGNVLAVINPRNYTTSITYDQALKLFPLKINYPLLLEERTAYYGVDGVSLDSGDGYRGLFGQVKSNTDFNNIVTSRSYDPLGRLAKVVGFGDTVNLPTTEVNYTPASDHWLITTKQRVDHGQAPTLNTYQFYDGLDRLIQTKTPLEAAGTYAVSGQTVYNHRGLPIDTYLPFSSNASQSLETVVTSRNHTHYSYDTLYRTKEVTNPDGTHQSFLYNQWITVAIDENGHSQVTQYDAYQRPIIREDLTGATGRSPDYPSQAVNPAANIKTFYYYDSQDSLINVTDAHGNYLFNMYDALGRKVLMRDPSMLGEERWRYAYDPASNLTYQADPNGQEMDLVYDPLNRLVTKKDRATNGATYKADYFYNIPPVPYGKGRLTKVNYQNQGSGQVLYSYDPLGRVTASTRQIDGVNYTIQRSYDAMSRLKSIVYPNGKDVRYTYNAYSGQAETVYDQNTSQTYVSNVDHDVNGLTTRIDLGNGKSTAYSYYPQTLRLSGQLTSGVQDLTYSYDSLGQIKGINNVLDNLSTQNFIYDEFNRLKSATGRYGTKNYTFDKIGNILSKDNLTYTYGQYSPGEGENVHSPVSLSDGTTFMYDQNSNLLFLTKSGVTTQFTYDIDNNLIQVDKAGVTKATYVYDGEGVRTKKTSFATGFPVPLSVPQTTYFIDGLYEAGTLGQVNHIYLGGQRIASVKNGQAEYYLTDHLGGTTQLLNAAGNVVEKIEYDPYGSVSYYEHPGTNNEKAFKYYTGQEFDGEIGLYYYGARHYDPALGRFLQADSIVQDPFNPQSFNRHSYTLNNPINRIDPTGNKSEDLGKIEITKDRKELQSTDSSGGSGGNAGGAMPANIDVGVSNGNSSGSSAFMSEGVTQSSRAGGAGSNFEGFMDSASDFLNTMEPNSMALMANPMADGMPLVPLDQGVGLVGVLAVKGIKAVEGIEKHHPFPKFLGGPKVQELVEMVKGAHRELHKDLREFLTTKYPGMVHSSTNPGLKIQGTFTSAELKNAISGFYKTFENKYQEAAKSFFEQFNK